MKVSTDADCSYLVAARFTETARQASFGASQSLSRFCPWSACSSSSGSCLSEFPISQLSRKIPQDSNRLPRSPRWLVKDGHHEEARQILERLRGEGSTEADSEFQNVCALARLEKEDPKQSSYWSMLTGIGTGKAHTARRVQLVVWLQILQEWIGIAGITIYGPEIFTIAGISSQDRQWVAGLNNITYMVGDFLSEVTNSTLN